MTFISLKMIIAAAQTIPKEDNTQQNMDDHCRLVELAALHKAQLIIFPELSLTGYERENAEKLSFVPDDPRLEPLKELAAKHHIIIIAGAPLKLTTDLYIGAFIIFPNNTTLLYTKQFLHDGEEINFIPGNVHNPQIILEDESFSLAICADLENTVHAENACKAKSTTYLASIFYSPNGIEGGLNKLQIYAKEHAFNVFMANYGGESYKFQSGGKSSFWSASGELKASLNVSGEGLLVATKAKKSWSVKAIETT